MSIEDNMNNKSGVKSNIGPIEELSLINHLVEGPEQEKVQRAIEKWINKWVCHYQYGEHIDKSSFDAMSKDDQVAYNISMIKKAKSLMSDALVTDCGLYADSPLETAPTIKSGAAATTVYREYKLYALRRWDK